MRARWADIVCAPNTRTRPALFNTGTPEFNCAYRHHLYPQGYAYRGRIIGHSLDNDSRMFSVAGLLTRTNGDVLSVALRRAKVNRDGAGTHAISDVPADLDNVELRYSKVFGIGKVSIGLGYDDLSAPDDSGSDVAWLPQLATGILMSRLLLVVVIALLGAGVQPASSQVPTAEQLELLKTMSPEDRQALMEQLGLGSMTGAEQSETPAGAGRTDGGARCERKCISPDRNFLKTRRSSRKIPC